MSGEVSGGVGRSSGEPLAETFVAALAASGRSSYTQRSYALDVRHFLRWLAERSLELEAVDRAVLACYVTAFRSSVGRALERAPSTVNQRVSALAAFFAFLAESDVDGWWDRARCRSR